jgi:hypothetical protein
MCSVEIVVGVIDGPSAWCVESNGHERVPRCPQRHARPGSFCRFCRPFPPKLSTRTAAGKGRKTASRIAAATGPPRHALARIVAWRLEGDPFSVSDREGGQHGRL